MKSRLLILFAKNDCPFSAPAMTERMQLLPEELHPPVHRLLRWQDRQACLLGKLLLQQGLIRVGAEPGLLKNLTFNAFGKPALPSGCGLSFNISHTSGMVVCAITSNGPIGIDVESIRPAKLDKYRFVFSESEWNLLHNSADPDGIFYTLWTKKEAVIKAMGSSVDSDLNCLEATEATVLFKGRTWYWSKVELGAGYVCHLATDKIGIKYDIESL